MWIDPIVEEIHQVREQLAKQFNNDIAQIAAHARQIQAVNPSRYANFPPRRTRNLEKAS